MLASALTEWREYSTSGLSGCLSLMAGLPQEDAVRVNAASTWSRRLSPYPRATHSSSCARIRCRDQAHKPLVVLIKNTVIKCCICGYSCLKSKKLDKLVGLLRQWLASCGGVNGLPVKLVWHDNEADSRSTIRSTECGVLCDLRVLRQSPRGCKSL